MLFSISPQKQLWVLAVSIWAPCWAFLFSLECSWAMVANGHTLYSKENLKNLTLTQNEAFQDNFSYPDSV